MSRDSIQTFYEPKAGGIGEGQLRGEDRAEYMRPSLALCRFARTKEAIRWWPGLFPLVFVGCARAEQAVRVLVKICMVRVTRKPNGSQGSRSTLPACRHSRKVHKPTSQASLD